MAMGFRPVDRDQQFLVPPDMREWLGPGHLVWFVIDTVERLDLSVFVDRCRLGGVGRRGYDPAMLLGLLIYGYAVGERSSRQIQRLCETDVAFRVICAQDAPDHSTIARFRKASIADFDAVFAQVLRLCARAGMVRLATVAIDGTKIAANASRDATRDADWFREQAKRITAEAAAVDAAEDAEFGVGVRGDEPPPELADPRSRAVRIEQILAELAAEDAEQAAADAASAAAAEQYLARVAVEPVTGHAPPGVDPVAAAQARLDRELAARRTVIEAYDAQVAAAEAAGTPLPKGCRVTDPHGGKRVKKALASLTRAQAKAAAKVDEQAKQQNASGGWKRNLTDPDSRLLPTRSGWVQGFNAQLAVSADWLILASMLTDDPTDVGAFTPMLDHTRTAADLLDTERETPEPVGIVLADAGYCSVENLTVPGPDRLIATGKSREVTRTANTDPVDGPPPADAGPIEAMRHRLRTADGARTYKHRAATVETVNAHLKDRIGLRRFSMRGLHTCQGELHLAAAVHNLRRLFTTTTAAQPA